MPERPASIATTARAVDAGAMAKRASDPHVVRVDPYIARPMMKRKRPAGVPDDHLYYRIGLKGRRLPGESKWRTRIDVRPDDRTAHQPGANSSPAASADSRRMDRT